MKKRGEFCFIPIICSGCQKPIELNPIKLADYLRDGFPKFHNGHNGIGKHRPEEVIKKISDAQLGSKNHAYGKDPWNKGTVGIMKPNSGCFQKGWKVKKDIKIALSRLEEQRLQKIKEFEEISKNRPVEVKFNNFGKNVCILDGILKKCKKPKAFCSNWEFCHKKGYKIMDKILWYFFRIHNRIEFGNLFRIFYYTLKNRLN